MKESVAFGRRADGPPKKVYVPPPSATFESFGFAEGMYKFLNSPVKECCEYVAP